MIAEGEVRRLASHGQVDPMILNLDYSLSWLLAALFSTEGVAEDLRFKGGTCLRKCYFPGYRFSEDLDFTAVGALAPTRLTSWVEAAMRWSVECDGPDFAVAPYRFEVVEDEYGKELYQLRLYFRGPLQWAGSPQAIRMDVTRAEKLLLPAEARPITHAYSDAPLLAGTEVICYPLLEILAEKVRAVSGQRRFAISRDLYDIHNLVQTRPDVERLASILPDKFRAREVDLAALDVSRLEKRRDEYERDWHQRLDYLVPNSQAVDFDQAWSTTLDLIQQLKLRLANH